MDITAITTAITNVVTSTSTAVFDVTVAMIQAVALPAIGIMGVYAAFRFVKGLMKR